MNDRDSEKIANELSQLCFVAADIKKQLERIAIILECMGEASGFPDRNSMQRMSNC